MNHEVRRRLRNPAEVLNAEKDRTELFAAFRKQTVERRSDEAFREVRKNL